MTENGFYIIKDTYFTDFPDPYLKGNKDERRPHYYSLKDNSTGIYWMIPMSSKTEKYKRIIANREYQGKSCDILHVAKLDNGKESAFLIQDIFPVTDKYIERKYTIGGNHFRVTSEHLAKVIVKKAYRTITLIRHGVKSTSTQPNVLKIEKELLK